MTIMLRPATESDVRAFNEWRYDPPYDVYNVAMDPDEAVAYFLGADVHCHTLVEGDEILGFCTFGNDAQVPGGDYTADALDIGLGVDPARTGSGQGHRYVAAVIDHARESFHSSLLRVSIAVGNDRAFRVWSQAGFSVVSGFDTPQEMMGSKSFAILTREA